jgi:hypothetical protein
MRVRVPLGALFKGAGVRCIWTVTKTPLTMQVQGHARLAGIMAARIEAVRVLASHLQRSQMSAFDAYQEAQDLSHLFPLMQSGATGVLYIRAVIVEPHLRGRRIGGRFVNALQEHLNFTYPSEIVALVPEPIHNEPMTPALIDKRRLKLQNYWGRHGFKPRSDEAFDFWTRPANEKDPFFEASP